MNMDRTRHVEESVIAPLSDDVEGAPQRRPEGKPRDKGKRYEQEDARRCLREEMSFQHVSVSHD